MKPSCGWISAVDSIQKITVVKIFDRRKNPQDVRGLTLYLGQIITLYLSLCCIDNIVQHSVFVEFSRMLASRIKQCKVCESGNSLAGIFLLREERYSCVIVSSENVVFLPAEPEFVRFAPFPQLILSCVHFL